MKKWNAVVLIFLAISWLPSAHLIPAGAAGEPAAPGYRNTETPDLQYPGLVTQFYRRRNIALFWLAPGSAAAAGRRQLLHQIDSAAWFGLDSTAYHPELLRRMELEALAQIPIHSTAPISDRPFPANKGDSLLYSADRRFTDAALALAFDRWRGRVEAALSYDGISPKFQQHDEKFILDGFCDLPADGIAAWLHNLQPATPGIDTLSQALKRSLDSNDYPLASQLATTLNIFRFIHHFSFDRYLVVNIPSAQLHYYSADTLTLSMRVVAGQTSKRTPRFAAWCNGLVLYPFWNIPRRIALREMLPLFRKAPGATSFMDIQVLDAKGRLIDPASIDWKNIPAQDFPYTLRQVPGCMNALGVLKFELTDPFDVYMHDTNFKRAFGSNYRYLSHGCIRLEKAAELGDLLLDHHLDTTLLASCLKDQRPTFLPLRQPVPVFVVYLTALPDGSARLTRYKDIYHLLH